MIEISHLCSGYPGRPVLKDISAVFPSGALTVVAGPNGCGKSTLLKTLCGIVSISSGDISIDSTPLSALRWPARTIAYLPQNRPTPDITVERLVLHGRFPYLSYPRRYRPQDRESARQAMAMMGLLDMAETPVRELSGGIRQKVYLAMALAQDTPAILLDEPTTYLDIAHQLQIMREARALCAQGKTVVMVLHDLLMAMRTADRLLILYEGRVAAQGSCGEVWESRCLDRVFGVALRRMDTPDGVQYYYAPPEG